MSFIMTFSYIYRMHLSIFIFPFDLLQSLIRAAPYSPPLTLSLVFRISCDCT